jgi:divalent metal cation (Fe/Co/Zn/Cd) transporter
MGTTTTDDRGRTDALVRRGLLLEYGTLGWNVAGCVIVLVAAYLARSVALAGFGIDSVIEIVASMVVVWQLRAVHADREVFAERLVGIAFLLLAIYLTVQSVVVLHVHLRPARSPGGIAWLALTAAAMFTLAWAKGRIGRALGNPVLLKESRVTAVDGLLAVAVLAGLLLDAAFGWWWADPASALVIVFYGLREGIGAFRS